MLNPIISLKLFQISLPITLRKTNLLKIFQDFFTTSTPTKNLGYIVKYCICKLLWSFSFFLHFYFFPSLAPFLSPSLSTILLWHSPSLLSLYLSFFFPLQHSFETHLNTVICLLPFLYVYPLHYYWFNFYRKCRNYHAYKSHNKIKYHFYLISSTPCR